MINHSDSDCPLHSPESLLDNIWFCPSRRFVKFNEWPSSVEGCYKQFSLTAAQHGLLTSGWVKNISVSWHSHMIGYFILSSSERPMTIYCMTWENGLAALYKSGLCPLKCISLGGGLFSVNDRMSYVAPTKAFQIESLQTIT